MATGGKKRCGAVCQHPGCWQATKKVYKMPTDYLNQIETRKRLKEHGGSVHADSRRSSYTEDGLPTLKVKTLGCDNMHEHRRLNTFPQSIAIPSLTGSVRRKRVQSHLLAPSRPEIHHVQMLLEDDDNFIIINKPMEVTYTPVLLWKPGRQKQHSQRALKPPGGTIFTLDKLPREYYLSKARILSRATVLTPISHPESRRSVETPARCVGGEGRGRRNSLVVCRTDLTNVLPPTKASLRSSKAYELQHVRNLQRITAEDGMSLSYLCDVDLPPQVLDEIVHQLRSESSISLIDYSPQQNTQSTTCPPTKMTPHTPGPDSGVPHLYKNVCTLSASNITKAARFSSPRELNSFSRQLSTNPQDAMQRSWKRRTLEMPPLDPLEEERIEAAKLSRWHRADNNMVPHCTGISNLCHSKDLTDKVLSDMVSSRYQHKYQLQQTSRESQVDSSRNSKQRANKITKSKNNDHSNCIVAPSARDTSISHHILTLKLDVDMDTNSGYTFSQNLPKRKFTPSACFRRQLSEDVSSAHSDVKQDLATYGRAAQFALSCNLSMPLTSSRGRHNLMASVSPDYMMMSAKFTRGNLILTDKNRGTVLQNLAMSDTESNFDLDREFTPSPEGEDDRPTNGMESSSICGNKVEDGITSLGFDLEECDDEVVDKQQMEEEEVEMVEKENSGERRKDGKGESGGLVVKGKQN